MQALDALKNEMGEMLLLPESPERFNRVIEAIAGTLMGEFSLNDTEIAIFLSNREKNFLSFAYPPYLVDAGIIPVNSSDAVVSQIFRTGRPLIENNFLQQKHLSIFETVKAPGKTIHPICKIMGVVLGEEEERVGVIEVSRRSQSFYEAGPDFTPGNLEKLKEISREIAPYFVKLIPSDFRGKLI